MKSDSFKLEEHTKQKGILPFLSKYTPTHIFVLEPQFSKENFASLMT
jgi:hypothetical protein